MNRVNVKVVILLFIKNFLSTFYVIPIWFIGVAIFGLIYKPGPSVLPFDQILTLLYGAGIIFLIGLIISSYYWAWLSYSNYYYLLENDGLHIQKGVLLRKTVILQYNIIENIEIYVNPIVAKALGLYGVHIKTRELNNTAGLFKKSHAETVSGLTADEAHTLRNELIKLSHTQIQTRKYFDPRSGKYI